MGKKDGAPLFEEHPDVSAYRRIDERQELGIECPACLRSLGHLMSCSVLKRFLAARRISLTLEDFTELVIDRATVNSIFEATISDAVRQTCHEELEQGRKRGWKFLDRKQAK